MDDLVDIVSKNGCLLLNIAPRPDGTIPEEQRRILLETGQWLRVNGEAIYGSRPWKVYGEGPTRIVEGEFKDTAGKPFTSRDIRFVTKGDTLYAVALDWPEENLVVQSLSTNLRLYPEEVESVHLLGSAQPLKWSREETGLTVKMPTEKPCDHAYTLRITQSKPSTSAKASTP